MSDKAIRAAKLTAAGILEKARARVAVDRAGGQIAPSKYLPDVPRQVHAAGGRALPQGYSLKVDPDKLGVLARFKGRNVGQLTLNRDRETGKLSAFQMAVHPDHQRKGLMAAMHDAAEDAFGKIEPDQTLTDQGFAFWKGYRPDAVSDNLRFHADKLMGKTVNTPYGPGTVNSVGRNGMNATLESGNTGWARARDNEDVLRAAGIDPSTLKYAAGGYVPASFAQPPQQLVVARVARPVQQQQGPSTLDSLTQLAELAYGKPPEAKVESPSAATEGHSPEAVAAGMSARAQEAMNALRKGWTGQAFDIESAYRDPNQNQAVGGAKGSQHLHGNAYDIDTTGWTPEQKLALATEAYNAGFRGFGFYGNNLHFDVGAQRAWGPSYHRESIPDWAQSWTQQYLGYASGGKVDMFEGIHPDLQDEQGNPKDLWHGTPGEPFDEFKDEKIGRRDPGFYGRGHYLTAQRGNAEAYADPEEMQRGSVMGPLHAALKNPFVWDASSPESLHRTMRKLQDFGVMGGKDRLDPWDALKPHEIDQFMKSAVANGHDGVIRKTGRGLSEIVVFKPSAIKHRDAKRFDPNDPNIYHARGGVAK